MCWFVNLIFSYKNMNDLPRGCSVAIILAVIVVIFIALFMRAPLNGSHVGYITAIDSNVFCTHVYVKTDLSSSQEDRYTINISTNMDELNTALGSKENVRLYYHNNVVGWCPESIDKVEQVK